MKFYLDYTWVKFPKQNLIIQHLFEHNKLREGYNKKEKAKANFSNVTFLTAKLFTF